ncbi:MAG: hypothetical protein JXR96_29445 [Deltaproteobacteria bacterium]|nr:hypothetical protein [Deltaproteobacteria bacterium]
MRRSLLGCVATAIWLASPSAGAQVCEGRALLAADGSSSNVDDCWLARLNTGVGLRSRLQACVDEQRNADLKVYGSFWFHFDLYADGRLARFRIPHSAFDRTGLPACVRRVFLRGLAIRAAEIEASAGTPARIQGRFTLEPGPDRRADRFSFSLTAALAPVQDLRPEPEPLPGGFIRTDKGLVARCSLAGSELVLRLCPGSACEARPVFGDPQAQQIAASCLDAELLEDDKRARQRGRRWREAHCLGELLSHADCRVKAAAADEIAEGWYWRARRALGRAARAMLIEPACAGCAARAPEDTWSGLALVRMTRALLRLRRKVDEDLLGALAVHPSRQVRRMFLREVLALWQGRLPAAVKTLMADPDPEVRAMACGLGCQHGELGGLAAFRRDLASGDRRTRASALLYARACARRAAAQVLRAAESEPDPVLALLMIHALPDSGPTADAIAAACLQHACPVARYLAARILGRGARMHRAALQAALERERDPVLRERLEALLRGEPIDGRDGQDIWSQLWLQDDG